MSTILVIGGTRGIGLEFTKQYAVMGWTVIPTFRSKISPALQSLQKQYTNIVPQQVDVASLQSIDALANELGNQSLDLIIHNAGLMGVGGGPNAQFGERFGTFDYNLFDDYFHVNTRAPIKIAEALFENIKAGKGKKFVVISSGAGSFGMPATIPGLYWYKASKTAVNMLMCNLARDFKPHGITVLTFHPGLVITERLEKMRSMIMKLPGQEKAFETADAVTNMVSVIREASLSDSGRFVKNDGLDMSW